MKRSLIALSLAVGPFALIGLPAHAGAPSTAAPSDAEVLKIGEREYFTKCYACHSLEEGGAHKLGPNLWGMFNVNAGSKPGFAYSEPLKKSGIKWSPTTMDKWLASPAKFMPGNLMAFAGLPNEQDRKALIVYLQQKTGAK